MAGRGYVSEAVPVKTDNILVLKNGRWQPMWRPINPDRAHAGVSLAESFSEKYAEVFGVKVGLIPCADGGTSLFQWERGSLLYDNAVYQAKLAMRSSTIVGVLWHQGEGDCGENDYPHYAENLQAIMDGLREDLNLHDVPFLLGGLGHFLKNNERFGYLKNYAQVNAQLKELAAKNKMTGYVSAYGLTSNPDNLHFNARSLHEFGLRYFDVFDTIRDKNKIIEEKPTPDDAIRSAMERL